MMAVNPHFLTQMATLPILNLRDGTDYPHSGLFDMLHKGMKGSFAYKASATDFDITQSVSGDFTQIVIAAGKVFRNGIMAPAHPSTVASDTIILDTSVAEGGITTTGIGSLTANQDVTQVSGGDVYLMVVVNASNVLKIVGNNSTFNKVPMILATDIPIAMIKMVSGSDDDAVDRPIQYFTTDKTANGLTLMYESGGVGSFAGVISSTASGTIWQTMSDISFMNNGSTTDIYIQDQGNNAATGPSLNFRNYRAGAAPDDYAGTINFNVFDNGGADAPIGKITSKALSVAASNEYGDMLFSIANQNGTLTETLSLVGSATANDVRVGVRIAAPLSTFEVTGTIGKTLIHNTTTTVLAGVLDAPNYFITDNGAAIAVAMPAAVLGREYHLKNNGGGTVTFTCNGSDTFTIMNGATPPTFDLTMAQWMTIVGASGTWHIVQKGTLL